MALGRFIQDLEWDDANQRHRLWRDDWKTMRSKGWTDQQITRFAPQVGSLEIGGGARPWMSAAQHGASLIGGRGLHNLAAAQYWVGRGQTTDYIASQGMGIGGSPVGRGGGWEGGFTPEAAQWLKDHYASQQEEEESVEEQMWQERIANIPTAEELMANMPTPKIRAGKDYATTGRSAQGIMIKKGTKFAEGGKRGTKGYFGRGAKFTGDTTPAMNIKGGGGGSGSQASNTLNTA